MPAPTSIPPTAGPPPPSRFLRTLGVRQKVLLILLAALIIALTGNTLLALRDQEQDVLREVNRRGTETARFVAGYLAHSAVAYDYHTMERLLRELTARGDIPHARALSARGNTLAEAGTPAPAAAARFVEPIQLGETVLGRLEIQLSTTEIVAELAAQQRASFLRQLLVILLVVLAELAALSHYIVRPARTLTAAVRARRAGGGDPMEPIALDRGDEFGAMAGELEALYRELDQSRRSLQGEVHAATAQLRRANEHLAEQARELVAKNSELERLALTDALTGFYNRHYFEALMESEVQLAIRNGSVASIIVFDIDHFKHVNDTHGHAVGDALLQHLAQMIARRLRRADVACRFGGDEFFVLCRGTDGAGAGTMAQELLQNIADEPLTLGDRDVPCTVSIGIATVPASNNIRNAAELFACADAALYESKRRGRNTVSHCNDVITGASCCA